MRECVLVPFLAEIQPQESGNALQAFDQFSRDRIAAVRLNGFVEPAPYFLCDAAISCFCGGVEVNSNFWRQRDSELASNSVKSNFWTQ
jgi:hypothetical protein